MNRFFIFILIAYGAVSPVLAAEPCNDWLTRYPMDRTQVTARETGWRNLIRDIERIDFDSPAPTLRLTWYLDKNFFAMTPAKFATPHLFKVAPELLEGWRNLGFLKDGKFALPDPTQVIERFNARSPMKAYRPQLATADSEDVYGRRLHEGWVPIVDVHDLVFHLPLLTVERAREFVRFMGYELSRTRGSVTESSLNTIFEQGTKTKGGVFIAHLIMVHSGVEEFDFSKATLERFVASSFDFLNRLGTAQDNSASDFPIYRLRNVMTDVETMWFTGLVSSHLKLLDLLHWPPERLFAITDPKVRREIEAELAQNIKRIESFRNTLTGYPAELVERIQTVGSSPAQQ